MSSLLANLPGETKNPFTNGTLIGKSVPFSEYSKQPEGAKRGDPKWEMTRGELMEFYKCPHKWIQNVPEKVTGPMKWGSLIDCLLLTPEQFESRYAVAPATYKNKKGETCDWRNDMRIEAVYNFYSDNYGKEIISQSDLNEAKSNVDSILRNPHMADLLKSSKKQVMVRAEYRDKETGIVVSVKCLLDLAPFKTDPQWGKCLGDLKCTTNASQGAWTRKVWDELYHVQAAFYSDAYKAATGEDRTDWFNAISEDHPPYVSAIWLLSADFVELGRMKYVEALKAYCQCIKSNRWPSYNDDPFSKWITPLPYMISAL